MNTSHYLQSVISIFNQYKTTAEKAMAQLSDEQLFWCANEESNSIAIIVNHLAGNMHSRWTDFLHSDGEKSWRNRELEFEPITTNRTDLLANWESGWDCLFLALNQVNEDNFNTIIFIRNEPHSITEAINRQVAHYAFHIGQIVWIAKMLKNLAWVSLSIPKGGSTDFNKAKGI